MQDSLDRVGILGGRLEGLAREGAIKRTIKGAVDLWGGRTIRDLYRHADRRQQEGQRLTSSGCAGSR